MLRIADSLGVPADRQARDQSLSYLERHVHQRSQAVQAWPAWAATQAFIVKVLAEAGRQQRNAITDLYDTVDRIPVFALSRRACRSRSRAASA